MSDHLLIKPKTNQPFYTVINGKEYWTKAVYCFLVFKNGMNQRPEIAAVLASSEEIAVQECKMNFHNTPIQPCLEVPLHIGWQVVKQAGGAPRRS